MRITEFVAMHGSSCQPIKSVVAKWFLEKKIDDFLGTPLTGGLVVADYWINDQLVDAIPSEVRDGFKELMKEKADTIFDIKAILREKAKLGEQNLLGLMNKIQGQIGENFFKRSVKGAELASTGNQRGFDVRVPVQDGGWEYVQVKIYKDANSAISEMKGVNEELGQGLIKDGETVVQEIVFAVNADIFDAVRNKAKELSLNVEVRSLKATRDEIRGYLQEARDNVLDHPLENFFHELFCNVSAVTSLHAAINGFFVWKGSKEYSEAFEDTFYSSVISGSGLAAAHVTELFILGEIEMIAGLLSTPVGGLLLAPVSIYTRGIFKRLGERRHVAVRFQANNQKLESLILGFQN